MVMPYTDSADYSRDSGPITFSYFLTIPLALPNRETVEAFSEAIMDMWLKTGKLHKRDTENSFVTIGDNDSDVRTKKVSALHNKSVEHFKRKCDELKNRKMTFKNFVKHDNDNALEASYRVSSQQYEAHTIAEILVKSCVKDVVTSMIGEEHAIN
ncbi:hypothetical protein NPIL_426891 [Nephila pilipes]|uniref:Uncharacterized protein n=1 Tax=Nephila pilipes TaxID=299642 RepID=A0A8X6R5D5_NEPPI|nr:hypothetical protein NPIL_426891 [Nephila pilipes]